jgi:NAD(P)H-dependent FMN reductase
MSDLLILVIEGSTRQARLSINAAKLIVEVGSKIPGVRTQLVDPVSLNLPIFDGNDEQNKIPEWVALNKQADAYFIVTPEYNHSFPASLKKLLDNDLGNYDHKPVAFAGVSDGPWGGTRAIESLLPVVRTIGMTATFRDVHFPKVQELFDADGQLLDSAYIARVERSYSELVWMAKALQWGRQNLTN